MYWLTTHAGFNKPLFIIKAVQCTKIITIKYKHEPVDFIFNYWKICQLILLSISITKIYLRNQINCFIEGT